jgi:hypothetical protein
MKIDEIINNQKNGGRGEKDSGKFTEIDIPKPFVSNFVYRK